MPHAADDQNTAREISNPFGLMARARVQAQKLPEGDPAAIRLTRLAASLGRIVADRRHLLMAMRRQCDD